MDPRLRLKAVVSRLSPESDFDQLVVSPVPAYAMSMHQALDSDCYRLSLSGQRLLVKLYHEELPGAPEPELALIAHRAAAKAGLAPQVLAEFSDIQAAVFADLSEEYRPATALDLTKPGQQALTLKALRQLHLVDRPHSERSVWSPFTATLAASDRLRQEEGDAARLVLPEDGDSLLSCYHHLLAKPQLYPDVPLHGEIFASNLLIDNDGKTLFVDFDRAAHGDPLWDLASLALACHLGEDHHASLLADYGLAANADALIRLRELMAVQDIGWGLWGRAAHFLSPRHSIEFFKYGETRLARARGLLHSLGRAEGQK